MIKQGVCCRELMVILVNNFADNLRPCVEFEFFKDTMPAHTLLFQLLAC